MSESASLCVTATHSIRQRVLVRVVCRCALLYLFQQQGVFDQTAPREIQEVPQVQFPAERRLLTQAQEVLHPLLQLLLVQQGFSPHLVTAVCNVGLQARKLQGRRRRSKWAKHKRRCAHAELRRSVQERNIIEELVELERVKVGCALLSSSLQVFS